MGSMDGLWGLLVRDLVLLLLIILVTVVLAIVVGLHWGGKASAFVLVVGLLVVILFLRPKLLGGISRKKPR